MPELIVLTPELVNNTFADCIAPKRKHLERVRVTVGKTSAVFDKAKLIDHFPVILLMLSDLPTEFRVKKQGGSGGWTMRNACKNKNGEQWTGLMVEVERLLALGMAQGWVKLTVAKEFFRYTQHEGDYYICIDLPLPLNTGGNP